MVIWIGIDICGWKNEFNLMITEIICDLTEIFYKFVKYYFHGISDIPVVPPPPPFRYCEVLNCEHRCRSNVDLETLFKI